jgi:hypothetical protein
LRCASTVDRDILVNTSRCSALTGNAGAPIIAIHQTTALFHRRTTRPVVWMAVSGATLGQQQDGLLDGDQPDVSMETP